MKRFFPKLSYNKRDKKKETEDVAIIIVYNQINPESSLNSTIFSSDSNHMLTNDMSFCSDEQHASLNITCIHEPDGDNNTNRNDNDSPNKNYDENPKKKKRTFTDMLFEVASFSNWCKPYHEQCNDYQKKQVHILLYGVYHVSS